MAEKPIIFSSPMIRAIMESRKTQTRRVIKPQPTCVSEKGLYIDRKGVVLFGKEASILKYKVGDILWVREAFCIDWRGHILYKADEGSAKDAGYSREPKWKPSIHMPRESARILLEVKRVRVERLQDISEDDARAEGVRGVEPGEAFFNFSEIWDSINLKRGFSWESNPWVVVVDFMRVK
jgi:hypothetical protein